MIGLFISVIILIHIWVTRPSFKDPTGSGGYRSYPELFEIILDGVCSTLSQIQDSRREAMIKKKEFEIRKLSQK